ncbi:hypothetical protein [Desulfovibrio subterraneus]|uniref:Uncharacterized protein n=1 Tax=Desulfovibrio subterraneus TaxID=2718620 RepID=A0A7J0BN59_9BACT|nr:hypothetical protein [Desulfovibrio subterraneus]GFM35120.1 hypothetical protein DSM101010T_34850 [Desulfovibrio subterraneus]
MDRQESYSLLLSIDGWKNRKSSIEKINTIIYVCEECEAAWLSLDGIFTEEDATAFISYIESLDLITRGVAPDWRRVLEVIDFVRLDDVECIIEKYGIEIVGSYC